VPRNAGINCRHGILPLVARLVQIRVAHPAVQNIDLHILRPRDGARPEVGLPAAYAFTVYASPACATFLSCYNLWGFASLISRSLLNFWPYPANSSAGRRR
jgi:hypothetical protein